MPLGPLFFAFAFGLLISLAPNPLQAHYKHDRGVQLAGSDRTEKKIKIEGAFARASAGTAKNGVIYLTIHNRSGHPDHLEGAKSGVAKRTELHTHKHDKGVMRMRPIKSVEIPAKDMAVLKPDGDHVMLMGLKAPLKNGDKFPLTLIFKNAGEVTVIVNVRGVGAKMPLQSGSGHGNHKH